jgi:N-acetylmuramic acid 6-phosphate etherase
VRPKASFDLETKPLKRSRKPPPTERVHPRARQLDGLRTEDLLHTLIDDQRAALDAFDRPVIGALAFLARRFASTLEQGGRVVYVGAGTSGRLGALEAAECPPTFGTRPSQIVAVVAGGRTALHRSIEGAEDSRIDAQREMARLSVSERDLVIGLSASGTTPFVRAALIAARVHGAQTALLCCRRPPPRPRFADRVIALGVGPELVAGSTRLKAGTATKIALNTLSTTAMIRLGRVRMGRMVALRGTNQKLRARAIDIVSDLLDVPAARARELLAACDWDVRRVL